jgi:hypothetical protein
VQPLTLGDSEVVVGPGVRFSVGGALSLSLAVWKRNLPFLLVVAALAQLPGFLASSLLPPGDSIVSVGNRVEMLLNGILSYVGSGLVTLSVLDQLRGRPSNNRRSISIGASQLRALVWTAIGTGLATGLLFLLLVVPGLIALVRWVLVAPIVVLEPGADPMARSAALTKGHRWGIFGILVGLYVGLLVVAAVLAVTGGAVMGGPAPSLSPGKSLLLNVITWIPGPLFLSFHSVLEVVLYEQLRAEKEGADVGQLTAVFE